jgi:hypothetical protein
LILVGGVVAESPWYSYVPDAMLVKDPPRGLKSDVYTISELWFLSPENGEHCCIHVAEDVAPAGDVVNRTNLWHIQVSGDTAVVRPSIHFIDHFHSPNPVQFRLVDAL